MTYPRSLRHFWRFGARPFWYLAASHVIAFVLLAALASNRLIASETPSAPAPIPSEQPKPSAKSKTAASSASTKLSPTKRNDSPPLTGGTSKSTLKAPKRNEASSTDEPIVRSKAESARTRRKSAFLGAPGAGNSSPSSRYGEEEIDWSELPPWKQTSFFGIRARGQFFIYVLDGSGSMIDDDRFPRATIELRRSVFALRPPQRFEVIFYNEQATPMPGGPMPRPADLKSRNELTTWLRLIDPDGETNPTPALAQAIALKPDAIFLLSDGVLPDGTVEAIAKLNRRKIPIHCIDLAGGEGGDQLQRIARENGGDYASRPGNLQGSP